MARTARMETAKFLKERDNAARSMRVHGGNGVIGVQYFFGRGKHAAPALLIMYVLPPGTSEGMHTHRRGDRRRGSYDEFYYIVAGRGEMVIAGETVRMKKGDHIFTPNGVPHSMSNTAARGDLKVYLVAMRR